MFSDVSTSHSDSFFFYRPHWMLYFQGCFHNYSDSLSMTLLLICINNEKKYHNIHKNTTSHLWPVKSSDQREHTENAELETVYILPCNSPPLLHSSQLPVRESPAVNRSIYFSSYPK